MTEPTKDQTKAQAQKAPSDTSTASKPKTVSVRASDAIAAYGGEFSDPYSGVTIGGKAVKVEKTAFVAEKLRSGEIVEED